MKKFLIIQPHSDDAILSCSSFLLNEEFESIVLTVENNCKRIKEDKKLFELIEIEYKNLDIELVDDLYSDFFKEYGKTTVLNIENVSEFYFKKFGIEKIEELCLKLNKEIDYYKEKGYKIVCPLGIGHPFHLLVKSLILDTTDFIFYKEFPHSYKKKITAQLEEIMPSLSKYVEVVENDDYHQIKFLLAQKFYKSQSGFFFYEKNLIEKKIKEEFFVSSSSKEKHIDIYVISKDRPNGKTFEILKKAKYPYKVVVEPQDYQKYKNAGHENIEVLPENDRGFSYTVNYSKNKFDGVNPVVIIDDDLMGLYYNLPDVKRVSYNMKTPEEFNTFFKELEKEICNTDFDYGTIGKSAFDWGLLDVSTKVTGVHPKAKYSNIPVFIIINNLELKNIDFDEKLCFKSDIDFSLKCMYKGYKYAKFIRFLQQTKMNKKVTQNGGLSETYKKTELLKETHRILLERWPNNIFEDKNKKEVNGVTELKVIYKIMT